MPQEQSEEVGKALQTCVSHLDSCLKFGELIGTSQWTSDDDSDLSIAWSLFMDNFNIASHLLNLAELGPHLFLGLQPQASPNPRLVTLGLIRGESTSSATSSRAETIEYWEDLRGRQEQDRLAGRRQGTMGMTPTGTDQHPISSPRPSSIKPPDPSQAKLGEILTAYSIPSDLPPPYQPPKSPIRILDDKGHHGDPQLHVVHRVASDSATSPGPASDAFHDDALAAAGSSPPILHTSAPAAETTGIQAQLHVATRDSGATSAAAGGAGPYTARI
ncbi:uncharacterized protein AKAW2_51671A [Aspergillus luchuensis]|uniref:Uncharacterized protein n=1 Tax=Aspergillus kawachii TaxID=1069201 RepID=A0A7R8ADE4_ASPKA|nr:uncharacterized protein AKAW2_51671A [Aspergillus luchuensis]BCS01330.1 hypothetical protein AKAW2_51671A [Aspergillus luchuensis]BCS13073.1 hypothetical protein ALUC_51119A [Aspergillus luchuensis]